MPHHYDAKLNLNPVGQALKAEVKLVYSVQVETNYLEFILHRDFLMDDIKASQLVSYRTVGPTAYPFAAEALIWRLEFAEPLAAGTERALEFRYGGHLKEPIWQPYGVNRLTAEWVELGMYGPWFPWNPQGGGFTYGVVLSIDPSYAVAATGQVVDKGQGQWQVTSALPMEDIIITAAPDFETLVAEAGRARFRICHVQGEDPAGLHTLREEGKWVLDFYQRWFGYEGQDCSIDLVVAPRTMGGGYARPGFIVLSDLRGYGKSPGNRLFRFIAHEFAHLWWTGAPVDTWEDWLNESFAEYSALVAVRERYGKGAFEEILDRRRRDFAELPPIRGLSRTGDKAYEALYFKGSSLLVDLERTIGEEKMTELLRRRLSDRAMSTASFLKLLTEVAGEHASSQFDQWLC